MYKRQASTLVDYIYLVCLCVTEYEEIMSQQIHLDACILRIHSCLLYPSSSTSATLATMPELSTPKTLILLSPQLKLFDSRTLFRRLFLSSRSYIAAAIYLKSVPPTRSGRHHHLSLIHISQVEYLMRLLRHRTAMLPDT